MMSVDDLTYSIAFSDEVFDNGEWHTYAGLETCNVIKPTRHGKETLGKGIQSNPAKEVSSNSNLTCLSGNDTKLGTDHTKADVYESSNNMSVSSSISENQMQSDSDLEDDLFSLAEDNKICSDNDNGSYFLAEESLEEVLDASSKSSPCTVVSSQENNSLTDLDPGLKKYLIHGISGKMLTLLLVVYLMKCCWRHVMMKSLPDPLILLVPLLMKLTMLQNYLGDILLSNNCFLQIYLMIVMMQTLFGLS